MSDGLSPEGRRRSGFYLLSAVLFLWLAAMVSIQFYQGAQVGYALAWATGGECLLPWSAMPAPRRMRLRRWRQPVRASAPYPLARALCA